MLYKVFFFQPEGVPAFVLTERQAAVVATGQRRLNAAYAGSYSLREEALRLGISQLLHVANYRYE